MIYSYTNPAAGLAAAALWILAEFSLFVCFQKRVPRRLEGAGLWAIRCVIWSLLTGLQIGQTAIPFFYNFILRILLLVLYTMAAGHICPPLALYVTIIFYLVKDICKTALLDVLCPAFHLPVAENPWLNTCSMALCALAQLLILRPLGRVVKMDGTFTLKNSDTIALLFPSIPYALIKYLQIIGFTYKKTHETETAVVCLMLCICDLIIFLQTEYRITTQQLREEAEALRLRSQARLAWHLQEQEKIDQINKIYHDMKHHLNYIRSLTDNHKIQEYVGSIIKDMGPCEMFSPTGSPVIDSVLAKTGADCARQGIRLIPSVQGECFEFVEPKDLLIIFGNALDNAMEALCRLGQDVADKDESLEKQGTPNRDEPPEKQGTPNKDEPPEKQSAQDKDEPPEIVVRAGARQNFAILQVENRFSGQITFDRTGAPRTTKGQGHGYGFKNIQEAARRYGGEAAVRAEGGLFVLTVIIPITH